MSEEADNEWAGVARLAVAADEAKRRLDEALDIHAKALAGPDGWPWRVSKAGNVVGVHDTVIISLRHRTTGEGAAKRLLNRSERRRMARGMVEAIAFRRDQTIAAAELALRFARQAWEEARPAEPGHITIGEHEYSLPDAGRVTAEQLAEAINAEPGLRAVARGSTIYIDAETIGPDCFGGSDEDSHYMAQERITATKGRRDNAQD